MSERADGPRRVVALGGGTGMPAVLRGLRDLVLQQRLDDLTAVVTMADDGGSSGRIRREHGLLPPGDVRKCLVALSAEEDLLAALFEYRYEEGEGLHGHNLGNLILAALAKQTGSFLKAVEVSGRVLRTMGRILPKTLEDVTLEATFVDGTKLAGESAIGASVGRIERLRLVPATARATPGVVEAIEAADLIVLGPGSLYTSVIPHLLVDEIRSALVRSKAIRVLVANLVGTPAEAEGLALKDHLAVIEAHAAGRVIDAVLVHEGPIDGDVYRRYRAEGALPLTPECTSLDGAHVLRRDLVARGTKLRHDPRPTADGLIAAWRELQSLAARDAS